MTRVPHRFYPLTSSQRDIWFDQILHPDIPLYNIGGYVKLEGQFQPILFEQALNQLVQKHDALRLVLTEDETGVPMQTVMAHLALTVSVQDFSHQDNAEESARLWMQSRLVEPFELLEKPLFRYDLVKVNETLYYWLMQYHHLIMDGHGIALVYRDLASLYTQLADGQTPTLHSHSYTDFIAHDNSYRQSDRFVQNRHYWLEKYRSLPEPVLSPRYQANDDPEVIGCEGLSIPRQVYQHLHHWAQSHHATFFRLLLGVVYVYFTRIAQREDLTIGFPILNRPNDKFKTMAGHCTLVNPAWLHAARELPFNELLQYINASIQEDLQHQPVPLSEINQSLSQIHPTQNKNLFDISISYQRFDYDTAFATINPQTTLLLNTWAPTPLLIFIYDLHANAEVKLDFFYHHTYFTAAEIKALSTRLMHLLQWVVTAPHTPIHQIPLLTDAEQRQLVQWNQTAIDYPQTQTLVDLFEYQADKHSHHTAIRFEAQHLNYQQLNETANQLAHYLIQQGIQADTPVALCLERQPALLIALLGILKAGAAYLPLDPAYPLERLRFMLTDSQAPFLLTEPVLQSQFAHSSLQIICLEDWEYFAAYPVTNPRQPIRPEHLAYLIYTSGSTGQPKGVLIEHQALICHCYALMQSYPVSAEDVILQFASITFDTALEQLLMAWLHGATSVLLPTNYLEPQKFLQFLQEQAITIADLPPAYWQKIVEEAPSAIPPQLHTLILGGEALPHQLVQSTRQHCPQLRLFNAYGPTEATITPTLYPVPETLPQHSLVVPIGRPRTNTRIYILDKYHQLLPPNIPGELCIAGVSLARGYLNRPDLTTEKFIEIELFGQTERLYKTGDLARWRPDGNLEYLGRLDHHIKLRGFRIELGEIETILGQHPQIQANAVVVQEVTPTDKRLVAYFVPHHEQSIDNKELRHFISERLPSYMIPSAWVMLEVLPLTPNGKVDRQVLAQLSVDHNLLTEKNRVAPQTPEEELLAGIWAKVLGIKRVSIHDNFFELGGHSLLATQVMSRVRDLFAVELPLRELFEYPTIAQLAERLKTTSQPLSVSPFSTIDRQGKLPLSFTQQSLWFLDQLEGKQSTTYNMPVALRLEGSLHINALERSFTEIVHRHESLRTTFPAINGHPNQMILEIESVKMVVKDIQKLSPAEQTEEVQRLAYEEAHTPFDLAKDSLLRVTLIKLDSTVYVLLITMHHIISDGWSISIFMKELTILYQAFSQNQPSPLSPLTIQYADFAHWQRQWLKGAVLDTQINYWKQQLADIPPVLDLPTDYPRPAIQSYRGNYQNFEITTPLTKKLITLSQQTGVTLFMTLLAAFVTLLHHYSAQNDIIVGSPIANRNRLELEDLIGFFANTLILRTDLSGNPTFLELLERVRRLTMAAYTHQDLPFYKLIEELQPVRHLGYNPIFQVFFALHNTPTEQLDLVDLKITFLKFNYEATFTDLTLQLQEIEDHLVGTFGYNTDLFEAVTITRLIGYFQNVLESIVANPQQHIAELPLLTTLDQQQLWFSLPLKQHNHSVTDPNDYIPTQLEALSDEEVNVLLEEVLLDLKD